MFRASETRPFAEHTLGGKRNAVAWCLDAQHVHLSEMALTGTLMEMEVYLFSETNAWRPIRCQWRCCSVQQSVTGCQTEKHIWLTFCNTPEQQKRIGRFHTYFVENSWKMEFCAQSQNFTALFDDITKTVLSMLTAKKQEKTVLTQIEPK